MFGRRTSVGFKLGLVLIGCITVLLLAATLGLSQYLTHKLEERSIGALRDTNDVIIEMIDVYNRSLMNTVARLGNTFAGFYPEPFRYDPDERRLYHGVMPIVEYDNTIPDRFTARAGVFATVLTRTGDDFARTSTSITDANGKRASGVPLGADHPAVPYLLRGEPYTGKARMLGRDVMTHYIPITDSTGEVIGAFFVGLDFTAGLAELKKTILSIPIGATGYPYAMDAGRNRGELTIHPALEGESLLDVDDANGRPFVAEMLDTKKGVVTYAWKNPGEDAPRDKIVVFNHYAPWDWLVASGSYLSEFNGEGKQAGRGMALVTLLLVPIVTLVIVVATRRWVSTPLREAVTLADRVADADLTVKVQVRSRDEIGQLMAALDRMVRQLDHTITGVRTAAEQVARDADALRVRADEVAHNSGRQSDAATGMAAAVEEMSASIDLIATNTGEAKELSATAAKASGDSAQTIRKAAGAMQHIAGTVRTASERVSQLGASSREISTIVNTIHDIAEQTNLLALNAAIEAARAGEQGRGFAVVADEVRKLAERTSISTQEITRMVEQIQRSTEEAVASMSAGVAQVDSGVALATAAEQAIQRIYDGALTTSDAVTGISNAIREQSVAASSVAQGVEQIAQMSERNNTDARESAQASGTLQQVAAELKKIVDRFRT
ncbi:MAG TPA: methyl-accepting chemotaxis protein [Rhodocyclaceae bacterium]|nr:methyl-accepting chemotaxis protein [Rhodocyclaceae bacterium]